MSQGGQNHRFIEVQESSPCNCLYLGAAQSASRHQMSVGMSLSRLRVLKKTGEWIHEETATGSLRAPPRRVILQWILDAWAELPTEVTKDSFRSWVLNLPVDDSFNDVIHRFKDGQPCSTGKAMLRSQLEILSEQANANPYDTTDSDVEEAYPPPLELLDSDQEGIVTSKSIEVTGHQ